MLVSRDSDDKEPFAVINEYKDPLDSFRTTAFGGSIDSERFHADLRVVCREEVIEESG